MLVLFCGSTAPTLQAQERVMTLRDCMEYAVSNSTKLRIQQAEIGDAQIARRDAILRAFTPTVDVRGYAYYNFGRAIDPQTNTYINTTSFHNGYSVGAGMTIFDGFSAVNNLKISQTSLAMGHLQEEQIEADICLATMEAYYNVQFYDKMTELYAAQVVTARETLLLVRRQEALGTKGHTDVVQMEADLADREYNLTLAENARNDAMITLQDVMFWPLDSLMTLAREDEPSSASVCGEETEVIVDHALTLNPALRLAQGTLANAKTELRTARWQTLPTLSLYAGWSTTYYNYPGGVSVDSFATQFKANGGEYVQLQVNIPLYDRLSRRSTIYRKKNAVARAEAQYSQKTREVESQVRRAVADRDGAAAAFACAERKLVVQEEAYFLNAKKFEQGLISSIEFQSATNNYLAAQADRLDAMFKFNIKASVVRYYNGEKYIDQWTK